MSREREKLFIQLQIKNTFKMYKVDGQRRAHSSQERLIMIAALENISNKIYYFLIYMIYIYIKLKYIKFIMH